MVDKELIDNTLIEKLSDNIKNLAINTRNKIIKNIREEQLEFCHSVGKMIVEVEQSGNIKAEYGTQLLLKLSKKLNNEIGKGFSRSNLQNMRKFFLTYPICQSTGKLSFTHYVELLTLEDEDKRKFYEKEAINSNWSVKELKRQIETALFERLLLSEGSNNKKKVLELSKKGQLIEKPEDILKEPYVLEFLGLPDNKPILERDLEKKLINHIESFLLELGRGFMFVGSQQRITLNGEHYYVDMVFYNKILKAYVLIDLKIGNLKAHDMGQMNMYLNYYEKEINDEGDNKPIGLVLCAEKDKAVVEYSLGGITNNLFASKYTYIIPDKEVLIKQVEIVLNEKEKNEE